MSNTLLPPFLFPPVSWFLKAIHVGEMRVAMGGDYEKQTYRNRYVIAGPNNLQNMIVPVKHTGGKKQIANTEISYNENWIRQHLNAIKTVYNNAPFYEFYDYKVLGIFEAKEMLLSNLIVKSIQSLHAYLCPELPLYFTEEKYINEPFEQVQPYSQVFEEKWGFRSDVSALDLLFNLGPEAEDYLLNSR